MNVSRRLKICEGSDRASFSTRSGSVPPIIIVRGYAARRRRSRGERFHRSRPDSRRSSTGWLSIHIIDVLRLGVWSIPHLRGVQAGQRLRSDPAAQTASTRGRQQLQTARARATPSSSYSMSRTLDCGRFRRLPTSAVGLVLCDEDRHAPHSLTKGANSGQAHVRHRGM